MAYQEYKLKRQVSLTSDLPSWESNQDFESHNVSVERFGNIEILLQKIVCVQFIPVTYTGYSF